VEERLRQLEAQLEEKNQELLRVRRRRRRARRRRRRRPFLTCVCSGASEGEDERGTQPASL